jgi:polysaccharide export outer membrane protein
MKKNSTILNIFFTSYSILLLFSCAPAKNLVYFQNLQKDTVLLTVVDNNFELKIRKNDLLYVGITSPDPVSTLVFNAPQGPATSGAQPGNSSSNTIGYLVDQEGNIILYKLGFIHVEGLTRQELKLRLEKDLSPYLKDVVVTVRFLNNHVTVLGEVSKPQVIPMVTEKMSLLEALGMSGDVIITGRKDNVLVIRETPSGKQIKRLNLTDKSIFNSPYYYLKPDDVVYVEPSQVKIKNSGTSPQTIGYFLTGLTLVITLLLNTRRN